MAGHMPEDLLPTLLKRLPVKTLARFLCVCKSWRSLLLSSLFNTHHFNFAAAADVKTKYYLRVSNSKLNYSPYRHQDLYNNATPPSILAVPFPPYLGVTILDVIHGVICLAHSRDLFGDLFGNYPASIVLWNPSIHKYIALPLPLKPNSMVGVGFDTRSNDFKVVCSPPKADYYEVLSVRDGLWRRKPLPKCIEHTLHTSCFFKGVIHWVGMIVEGSVRRYGLILFDCEREELKTMDLPQELVHGISAKLLVCGGKLSVLRRVWIDNGDCGSYYEVWTMEEDGCVSMWTRQNIAHKPYGGDFDHVFEESLLLVDIGKHCEDLKDSRCKPWLQRGACFVRH